MSRFNKWVPFFEESSEKRDSESWWEEIKTQVLSWGLEVKGLVSDRASALVKLGKSSYLGVYSMPDLFHFMQDINKMVGLQIGRKRAAALKALSQGEQVGKNKLKEVLKQIDEKYQSYREQLQQINKTIHPFNESDEWTNEAAVEKSLLHGLTSISKIAKELELNIELKKGAKVLRQISPIAKAVHAWIEATKQELEEWKEKQLITTKEKQWLIECALPYCYWKIQVSKTPAKLRNQNLRANYKQRLANAEHRYKTKELTKSIEAERQKEVLLMAHRLAISFQRASSQTEGRNGYLAFIHHAHKGIPKQRLKALTVIHNFDTRRADQSTPAQRLFRQPFPDLFEFLSHNVTGFKEPRKRKHKPLTINNVQP